MVTPKPMSELRFWLLTIALLVVWSVVLATASSSQSITANEKEQHNARNCKALCGHCGCLAFYCGEECICECNKDNKHTECIGTMQRNARKLNIPFELLIQGPSANSFTRNALQFDLDPKQGAQIKHGGNNEFRNKRSTIVIYKPKNLNTLNNLEQCEKQVENNLEDDLKRQKRGTTNIGKPLDWFSDLASSLVRPAPFGQKYIEESKPVVEKPRKRSPVELDRSWFNDNTNSLLRPSPLFRNSNDDKEKDDLSNSNFPRRIKDTIRNMQEARDDFSDTFRMKLKDAADDIQARLQGGKQEIFDSAPMPTVGEAVANMAEFLTRRETEPKIKPVTVKPIPPPSTKPKYMIPWFRPVRFLQRIQEAIN